jgi:DNA replication protein DnaC
MKAPAAARALPKLAERARQEEWGYERFAEALLSTELSSRESSGGRLRIRAARFPAHKTLEEFDFTFQRSVRKQTATSAPSTAPRTSSCRRQLRARKQQVGWAAPRLRERRCRRAGRAQCRRSSRRHSHR